MRGQGPILALLGFTWMAPSVAATPEYQVKAAWVYNFAKFIEWPDAESLGSMTICVYGKDPFGGFLDEAVRGKLVRGRPILIRRLPAEDESWAGCQILFFGLNKVVRVEAALARLQGSSILTIGESDGFARLGGMIGLVVDQGRVRFDINLAALAGARLKASSQLMEIGRVVGSRK
jgi:hypothetical protein